MQAQHNHPPSFKEVLGSFTPWINEKSPIYPLNRYLLRRNIAGFAFSEKISKNDAKHVAEKLQSLLMTIFPTGQYFKSNELEGHCSQFLFEHLFLANFETLHPEGGVFIDLKNNVVAIIHLQDHLTIFLHDSSFSESEILNALLSIDQKMQAQVPFAFSDLFGFLTSNSTTLGTALSKEAILHTPAINFLKLTVEENDHTLVHGLLSDKNVPYNITIATNKYCLGVSERSIIANVDSTANKLLEAELAAIKQLQQKPPKELHNILSKNFGQILFCKSLQLHEALTIASSIDLGISLGLIEATTTTFYFNLFFALRRAHLETLCANNLSSIEEQRAEFFKEKIKDLKLLI